MELFYLPDLLISMNKNIMLEREYYDRRHYILEQQEIYERIIKKKHHHC
jgi:hypothetical protein